MPEALDPTGSPVTVGSVTLVTPGLIGMAESHPPGAPSMRAAELATADLEAALAAEELEAQETIEISETEEIEYGDVATRGAAPAPIEVSAPAPADQWGQLLLASDEAGVMTWNFAPPAKDTAALRGESVRTYYVRRTVPPAERGDGAVSRGLIGAIGTKVLKVLAFKLLDKVAGEVGDYFVGRWEQAKRPYRVRAFGPADYRSADALALDADGWEHLTIGRALLFLHGTFSRAHNAFGGMPPDLVAALHTHYDGRVFAFDHFTLSHDPYQNVDVLLAQIPEGAELEVDMICHSRGGLVGRVLAEKQSEIGLGSRRVNVRKVAFVGTPNAGTVLADADHFGELVDTYTNLLNFFPDTGVIEVLQTVIAVVKQLAVGAARGLVGLDSMVPDGEFLRELNRESESSAEYFALASDFEPESPGFRQWATDTVVDALFAQAENDLVVPTLGVYQANGSPLFPIPRCEVLRDTNGVGHSRYFSSDLAQQALRAWLQA